MDSEGASGRDVQEILVEFASLMGDQLSAQEILERLGDYCTELLPVHGVGVLLRVDDALTIATANTEIGQVVEQLETDLGEGPCTTCLETGEQILVPDLAAVEADYPRFVPRALEAGVRAIHGLPMVARGQQLGAMNIINLEPRDLGAEDLATAQMLADVAIAYLVTAHALESSTKLATQLQQALDSRILIEQAKGLLSERHGVPVSEAFELMRRHARSSSRKLVDLAAEVLRGELRL